MIKYIAIILGKVLRYFTIFNIITYVHTEKHIPTVSRYIINLIFK